MGQRNPPPFVLGSRSGHEKVSGQHPGEFPIGERRRMDIKRRRGQGEFVAHTKKMSELEEER